MTRKHELPMRRSAVKANIVPLRSNHVSFYRFKSGIDADLEIHLRSDRKVRSQRN